MQSDVHSGISSKKYFAKPTDSFLEFFFLSLLVLYVFAIRKGAFPTVFGNFDEWIYILISKEWVDGNIPYRDFWDHKGPLLYFLWAIPKALGSQLIFPAVFLMNSILVATSLIIYFIAKQFYSRRLSWVAAFFYACLLSSQATWGLRSNSEIVFLFFNVLALFFILKKKLSDFLRYFLSGFLICCSLLIKPQAIFTVLPLLFFFKDRYFFMQRRFLLRFVSGFALPLLIFVSYFLYQNAFQDFWNAYFVFNSQYFEALSLEARMLNTMKLFVRVLKSDFVFLPATVFVVLNLFNLKHQGDLQREGTRQWQGALFVLLSFSLLAVFMGGMGFESYLHQTAFPIAFLVVNSLSKIKKQFEMSTAVVAVVIAALIPNLNYYWKDSGNTIFQIPNEMKVGSYLQSTTERIEEVLVIGRLHSIYHYAQRKPLTKYLGYGHYCFQWNSALKSADALLKKLETCHPSHIVSRTDQVLQACGDNGLNEKLIEIVDNDYKLEKEIGNYFVFKSKGRRAACVNKKL